MRGVTSVSDKGRPLEHLYEVGGSKLSSGPSVTGRPVHVSDWYRSVWKPLVTKIGRPEIGTHALRHTHASQALSLGMNITAAGGLGAFGREPHARSVLAFDTIGRADSCREGGRPVAPWRICDKGRPLGDMRRPLHGGRVGLLAAMIGEMPS